MMGSKSDLETMQPAAKVLKALGLAVEVRVLSAHRTPAEAAAFVKEAVGRGVKAFICGAGGAAHLAGAVAAHTTRPVIGVPINAGSLGGLDSLLSTVQMPPGMPVATVAVGGSENAGPAGGADHRARRPGAGGARRGRAGRPPEEGARQRRRGARRTEAGVSDLADEIAFAVSALRRGDIVAYPTETFYGLGVDALDELALARLRHLKGRDEKAISVLVDGPDMLDRLCLPPPPRARELMRRHWPGALTLVLPAREGLPAALVSEGCIAVRQSSHPTAQALVLGAGQPADDDQRQPRRRAARDDAGGRRRDLRRALPRAPRAARRRAARPARWSACAAKNWRFCAAAR